MDILREKIADLIKKGANLCRDPGCSECGYAYIDLSCRFYSIADYLIANGVRVQEWISVKDRLPEDDLPKDTDRKQIRCLVATDKGTVKSCVRQRYQTKKNGQWCLSPWEWNKDLFAKPTHWMPMPEPPKGE